MLRHELGDAGAGQGLLGEQGECEGLEQRAVLLEERRGLTVRVPQERLDALVRPGSHLTARRWGRRITILDLDRIGAPFADHVPEVMTPIADDLALIEGVFGEPLHLADGDIAGVAGQVSAVHYRVVDPVGNELTKGTAKISALGGFDVAFTLPRTPNLGHAQVYLEAKGRMTGTAYHGFQIQEFRRPEYEVSATASQGPHMIGGGADVTVDEIIIEFEKPAPFSTAAFKSRKPGAARPHRQLSGPAQKTAAGKRVRYAIKAMTAFKTELASTRPSSRRG